MTRRMAGPSVAMSKPATRTVPLVGARSVVMILMAVLLPAPFGPRNPKHSPSATWTLTSSTARTGSALRAPRARGPRPPAYTLTRLRTSMIGRSMALTESFLLLWLGQYPREHVHHGHQFGPLVRLKRCQAL